MVKELYPTEQSGDRGKRRRKRRLGVEKERRGENDYVKSKTHTKRISYAKIPSSKKFTHLPLKRRANCMMNLM